MSWIGVDIGQTLGWAYHSGQRVTAHGTLKMAGRTPDQLRKAQAAFTALLALYQPDRLAMEDVQFARYRDAHASYWRIRTLVELAWHGPAPELVSTGELKRWATGKGNADKAAMCQAASARVGHVFRARPAGKPGEEDQADACLVALWAADPHRQLSQLASEGL